MVVDSRFQNDGLDRITQENVISGPKCNAMKEAIEVEKTPSTGSNPFSPAKQPWTRFNCPRGKKSNLQTIGEPVNLVSYPGLVSSFLLFSLSSTFNAKFNFNSLLSTVALLRSLDPLSLIASLLIPSANLLPPSRPGTCALVAVAPLSSSLGAAAFITRDLLVVVLVVVMLLIRFRRVQVF